MNTTTVTSSVTTGTTVKASTSIGPITQTLPPSTAIYTTGSTTAPSTRTTVLSTLSQFTTSPTLCACIRNGTSYRPGDMVYNVTDGLGWCYIAYCNASCNIVAEPSLCNTTPIPSTTAHSTTTLFSTSTKATISSSVPPSTTVPTSSHIPSTTPSTTTLDCNDVDPPRKNGETWKADNCTTAVCTNGKVTETQTPCPTVEQPICANGRKAVKVYDGCCFHYECECVCSGWSGAHYMTFDGKSYSFDENCTYYLVKEIITKYNLTIILNNQDCDPSDSTFCPQSLYVIYQSYKVVLTQLKTSGTTNVVYVNQKRIYPAYSNSVLRLTGTDMVITLEIPAISTKVVYRGNSFSIDLPYSLFEGNTEGQCGTCDNSKNNDCRSPNGQVESCSDSAGQWHVPGTSCVTPTTPPTMTTSTSETTTKQTTTSFCKPAICDLLTSSVFEPCHKVISPGPFVRSCVYDICKSDNNSCSSLEAYATECANGGVCIDWRNATNGQCEHKCPSNKVYMVCGPTVEPTCNNGYNKKFQADGNTSTNYTKEGCFCPHGTTLFNTVYDECVTSCDCVGPDGKPKQPNETWKSGCNNCVCDKDSMSIQCEPIKCSTAQSPSCSEPGQQLVNKTDGCCTTQSCECNVNLCPAVITCPLGFRVNATKGTCCQSYECVPKGVCVYDMKEYKPGAKIPTPQTTSEPPLASPSRSPSEASSGSPSEASSGSPSASPSEASSGTGQSSGTTAASSGKEAKQETTSEGSSDPGPCQDCYCGPKVDPTTKLNIINCKPLVCNTTCSKGYEYQTSHDKCCGTCVQKSCIFTTPDNTTQVIEVNNTFVPSDDKCVVYTCENINGQPVTKETKSNCPHFNPLDCEPGTETTDANGCCKSCKIRSVCEVQNEPTVIEVNGCKSAQPVNMTSCSGHCGSSSIYSAAANKFMHQCECCQETSTSQKQVELVCADGSKEQHSYMVVNACSCSKSECVTSKPQRRRRR
uniref:Uncharacterized protein n=2 Tax=Seriola dumerili TaxID=41447 RepID=A0A3B4UC19_SERDU